MLHTGAEKSSCGVTQQSKHRFLLNDLFAKVLATLVTLLFQVDGLDWTQPADHVETFAGAMAVTRAEWMDGFCQNIPASKRFSGFGSFWDCPLLLSLKEGRHAIPLDLALDPNNMDFLTDKGFCNCLYHICNSKPGSGYLTAPVCSTFVFMSTA